MRLPSAGDRITRYRFAKGYNQPAIRLPSAFRLAVSGMSSSV